MNYIDFAIASSIFIIFFGVALMFSTNYFSNLSSLTKTSEFRSVSENFFKIFFESKGTPENWDDYSNTPVKIGLAEDLYKIPILLKETSGYNRTYELISRHIVFDENCENKTWNNTVRVFDEDYKEYVYKLSDETFCSNQYLKEANITWEVNVSANQNKKFFIYYSSENNVNFPTFTTNLTVVGVWHLDEGSGSIAYDETGNNNDGTLYNGTQVSSQEPTWASSCKSENCLVFDGSNDYVDYGNNQSLNPTNEITVETWVKWANFYSDTAGHAMISKSNYGTNGYMLYQSTGSPYNRVSYFIFTDSLHSNVSQSTLSTDTWYHIVMTYDDSNIKLYINGSLDSSIPATGSIYWGGTVKNFLIGSTYNSSESKFNGTIDEVKIYNRALSSEEVNASYSVSPLVKKTFPEEKITAVSGTKLDVLKNISYDEVRKTVGENYKFRLEVDNETYGGNINMSANVGCSEYPKIVEYKNGTVSKILAKMCVWK